MKRICLGITLACVLASTANAGGLSIPNEFTAGTPAVAAEVNANFAAVAVAVNDNNVNIVSILQQLQEMAQLIENLQAQNVELTGALANLQQNHTSINPRLANLEENIIPGLKNYLQLGNDAQSRPTIFFTGVNVHINNGMEDTAAVNGVGNLIIGYDALRAEDDSDGLGNCNGHWFTSQTQCENNGWVWAYNHKSGSHNLIIGDKHNYSSSAGLVAGKLNTVNAPSASAAGYGNSAGGEFSSVSGGMNNRALGVYSSISGGYSNQALGEASSVSGGSAREAATNHSWGAGSLWEAH